jgi:flagellar hook protein FlgE
MLEMVSAIDTALSGLNTASRKVGQAANNIANMTTPGYTTETGDNVELSQEAVNMMVGEAAYKANLKVIQTTSDMDKDLLKLFDKKI